MPEVLKQYQLFIDGVGYAGKVDEVTPPKLTLVTDEHRAGGMDAGIDIDMGIEKPTLGFVMSEYNADVTKQFGIIRNGDLQFTLRGAMQRDGGEVVPIVIKGRGIITEIDDGTYKVTEKTQMKVAMSLRYYKREQGGVTLIEIDVENMIRIIDGVDQLAGQRAAIGL